MARPLVPVPVFKNQDGVTMAEWGLIFKSGVVVFRSISNLPDYINFIQLTFSCL